MGSRFDVPFIDMDVQDRQDRICTASIVFTLDIYVPVLVSGKA